MFQACKNYLVPATGHAHKDILSGITVALALVPEAVAFALVAHVNPLVGLYAAFFMCLITALLGGRPGMISGATGSMAVVMVSLVAQHGVDYLFPAVILTGLLQILAGLFRMGKFIRLMPKSVMVGFVNGLAIVIFMAQLQQFKWLDASGHYQWLPTHGLIIMLGLVGIAMVITHYLPRLTTMIPSALTAIVVVSALVMAMGIDTRVVADMLVGQQVNAHVPSFSLPTVPINLATLQIILPYAVILAVIGLCESLMTLALIDERTQSRGQTNRECIAQGLANMIAGGFKTMGGCAMIGQSMINITSGARGRLSGIIAALCLLLFIMGLWPLIKLIPLAALVGVMFMVVIETFEWATFEFIGKIPVHDAVIIITVTLVTVFTDLAIAVAVGMIMATFVFAWQTAKRIHSHDFIDEQGCKTYVIHGPLFFGSATEFKQLFTIADDPSCVIIDFKHSQVADHSALDAIQNLIEHYQALGKTIKLSHLNSDCEYVLKKSNILSVS